jgi:hypothetical protein
LDRWHRMYLPNSNLCKVLSKNLKLAHVGQQQWKQKNIEFMFVEINKNIVNKVYAFIFSVEDDRPLWSTNNPHLHTEGQTTTAPLHFHSASILIK